MFRMIDIISISMFRGIDIDTKFRQNKNVERDAEKLLPAFRRACADCVGLSAHPALSFWNRSKLVEVIDMWAASPRRSEPRARPEAQATRLAGNRSTAIDPEPRQAPSSTKQAPSSTQRSISMLRKASMTRGAAPAGTTCILSLVAMLVVGTASAHAGPCTADIARFEQEVQASKSSPDAGPGAPQSFAADLEHQPTPASVAAAKALAEAEFAAVLARAKTLDAQNDKACLEALAKARLVYFQ
jgi:hypothetical protein